MNKSILSLLLIPSLSFALQPLSEEQKVLKASQEKENMKMLAEMGLPLPDSGIKIVPRAMMGLPQEIIDKGIRDEQSIKENGYISEDTVRPMELINFKAHALDEYKQYKNNNKVSSTHIRNNIKDLKLGFEFKGIPSHIDIETIGFVPQGSFDEESGGWSGVVQFFNKKDIGTCAYAIRSVKVSHTAAELAMEDVTYDINNKATLKKVHGNKDSGFVYKIEWFDTDNFHALECANKNYSVENAAQVITLAQQIDSN